MTDYFSLGSVPIDIDPVQVGSQNYEIEAKKECKKYIKLLKKKFSNIPKNCSFIIKNNPHDFGNYFDVNLKYDNENPEHQKFMLYVDRNIPYDWEEPILTKKEKSMKDLNIKFGKFKKEIFYGADVELDKKTKEELLKYGRSHIVNDEEKILDYAVNKLLKDSIEYFKNKKQLRKKGI